MGDAKKEHIWEFVLILGLRRRGTIAKEIGEAKKGTYENLIRDWLEKDRQVSRCGSKQMLTPYC